MARLQKVMTMFLLRRKKDSQLDGKNLIELPPKEVVLLRLEFSEEEREIYSMVTFANFFLTVDEKSNDDIQIEARSQAKFNRYLRAGTVLKYVFFIDAQICYFLTGFTGTTTKFSCYSFVCDKFVLIPL